MNCNFNSQSKSTWMIYVRLSDPIKWLKNMIWSNSRLDIAPWLLVSLCGYGVITLFLRLGSFWTGSVGRSIPQSDQNMSDTGWDYRFSREKFHSGRVLVCDEFHTPFVCTVFLLRPMFNHKERRIFHWFQFVCCTWIGESSSNIFWPKHKAFLV